MTFFDALLLALPAFVANIAPVLVSHIRMLDFLALPVDGGRMWNGKAILGAHKTWRGVFAAILFGGIAGSVLGILATFSSTVAVSGAFFGMYAGLLAIGGDALKSLVKRRIGVESGKPWLPWDQIDYMLMFLVGTAAFIDWSIVDIVSLLLVAFVGNLGINYVAHQFGIKSTPW